MGNRKFKIGVNDIKQIIDSLNLDHLIIELPDSKDTYKALGACDWDFYDESGEEPILEVTNNEEKEIERTCDLTSLISSYNELATFIEASYRLARKSPDIIYGSNLYNQEISKLYAQVGSEDISIDHSLISSLLSAFFGDFMNPENMKEKKNVIVEDVDSRLKEHWKEAPNHPSVLSFMGVLFKKA